MKKIIIFIIISSISAFAISEKQMNKANEVFEVGVKLGSKKLGYILAGIFGTESSWGNMYIGDKYKKDGSLKPLYKCSLGNFQIKLSSAREVFEKTKNLKLIYPEYYFKGKSVILKYNNLNNYFNKHKYLKTLKIYSEHNFKKYNNYNSILNNKELNKKFILRDIKTVELIFNTLNNLNKLNKIIEVSYNKEIILYNKNVKIYNKIYINANKEIKLMNRLICDYKFSAEIAGNYLYFLYKQKKSIKRVIGRYNGGWNNITYYNRVIKNIKNYKKNRSFDYFLNSFNLVFKDNFKYRIIFI